jgi:heme exporter protein B
MSFPALAFAIALKDLRSELRDKQAINAALAFSIVILLLFSFAFDPTDDQVRAISGGLLWIVFAFAAMLVLGRSFARELPNDCLDALIAAPVPGAALFLGKAAASFCLILAVELISLPIFGIFYNVRWTAQFWQLLLILSLGTWGLAVIGTAFGALTVNLRLRELMLPLLVYPMMIPALLGAMTLTAELIAGKPMQGDSLAWLRLLIGFDIIFTAVASALAETILIS